MLSFSLVLFKVGNVQGHFTLLILLMTLTPDDLAVCPLLTFSGQKNGEIFSSGLDSILEQIRCQFLQCFGLERNSIYIATVQFFKAIIGIIFIHILPLFFLQTAS